MRTENADTGAATVCGSNEVPRVGHSRETILECFPQFFFFLKKHTATCLHNSLSSSLVPLHLLVISRVSETRQIKKTVVWRENGSVGDGRQRRTKVGFRRRFTRGTAAYDIRPPAMTNVRMVRWQWKSS